MEYQEKVERKLREITEAIRASDSRRMNAMLEPEFCSCDAAAMTAEFRFRKQEWEKNQRGEAHGGAIAAMFDTSMGMSVMAFLDCRHVSTADINVSYIRPFLGASFLFHVEVVHPGKSLVRMRAVAKDETSGKTLASAMANFVYLK